MAKKKKTPDGIKMLRTVGLSANKDEILKKHEELSTLQLDYFELEDFKRAEARKHNNSMKEMKATIRRLSRETDTGTIEQEVEVTAVKNHDANEVEYWFEGQIVDQREMTEDDRQVDLEDLPTKTKRRSKKAEFTETNEPNDAVQVQ